MEETHLPNEDYANQRPALGPVTQDDPEPQSFRSYPDAAPAEEGGIILIAAFEDISGADACASDLEARGIEVGLVARRGDGPEQGIRPGNVITGPGYGLSAPNQSPPKDGDRLGAGVTVGATIGATAGLLAANYFIPGLGYLVASGSLVSTLVGGGIGSMLGGFLEYAATDHGDDASMYAGQVRRGGVLLVVRTPVDRAAEVHRLMEFWRPLEIREQ